MDESESKNEKQQEKRRLDPELLKKGLRCDLDQYEMLKRCSENKNMSEWNQWRKKHPDEDILLQGAKLQCAYLKGALLNTSLNSGFSGVIHLEYTKLHGAYLESADLSNACLQGAKFLGAHIEGVDMRYARLEGADFSRAIVDGGILICKCKVDRSTKFEGVGLDTARIYPDLKQLLEYNIRRMNWEQWYKYKNWQGKYQIKRNKVIQKLMWFIRVFWWFSDYGRSTGRIIFTFFGLAIIFANIYYHWGRIAPPGIVKYLFVDRSGIEVQSWLVPLRTLYFSIVTMTTLGFGDMYANAQSILGHLLLMIQVILGYVLLGALVTRFAVLFTAGGPAGKFADEKGEKDETE